MQCQSHHHQQHQQRPPSSSSWYDNSQPHYNSYPRNDYYEECCRSQSNHVYYEECHHNHSSSSPPQYDQHHSDYAAQSQQYSSQYQSYHTTPQDHYNVYSREQYQYIIPNDHYSSSEHYSNNCTDQHYANPAREQYYSPPPQYVQQQSNHPQNNTKNETTFQSKPLVNPPRWASPAKGESYLEPACSAISTHTPTPLTTRPYFRIGRAPSSDIPLLHTTCSRRHALLYHDPQGHCYVRDCHSAHGTYVDGRRVHPARPRRVRRGALLRFGGVEAPSFVLKSFQVGLGDIVRNLGGVTDAFFPKRELLGGRGSAGPTIICESSSIEEDEDVAAAQAAAAAATEQPRNYSRVFSHLSHGTVEIAPRLPKEADSLVCIREDGGGLACIAEEMDAPVASLVLLNTRLNAIGDKGLDRETRWLAKRAQDKFSALVSWGRGREGKRAWTGRGEERAVKRRKMGILVTEEKKKAKRHDTATTNVIHCVPDGAYSYQDVFRSPRRSRRVKFSGDEQYDAFQPPIMMCSMSMDSQDLETATVAPTPLPEKVMPEVTSSSRDVKTPVKAAVVPKLQEVTPEKTTTGCIHCKTSICSFCKLLDASEEEYAKVNCIVK